MRPRRSVSGPLILIAIGVVFLLHTISPEFRVVDLFAHYWPYFLILWGVLQLVEIAFTTFRGVPVANCGIGGGGWLAVLLICLFGVAAWETTNPGSLFHHVAFENGMDVFGQAHDYSIAPVEKQVPPAPHVVIERFRGDAKITGVPGTLLTLTGHKTIRSLDPAAADRTNGETPVDIVQDGKTVVIRCHQEHGNRGHELVTTDLELNVPNGASVEVTGTKGDFVISALAGDVDVSGENAAVRARDVKGNVRVETGRSDEILCAGIGGSVSLHGRGTDVELSRIEGDVTVDGDYSGVVTLNSITHPVHINNARTKLTVQKVSGELKLARGSLDGRGLVGPVTVAARATDVTLTNFTDGLDLTVDKGDIDLKPVSMPLGNMNVRTNSGDIDVALPPSAAFVLTANTDRGSIDNNLGPGFEEQSHGHGAHLQGGEGSGPDVRLSTSRGDINVHRGEQTKQPAAEKGDQSSGEVASGAATEAIRGHATMNAEWAIHPFSSAPAAKSSTPPIT